jgi:hypothetical protein
MARSASYTTLTDATTAGHVSTVCEWAAKRLLCPKPVSHNGAELA